MRNDTDLECINSIKEENARLKMKIKLLQEDNERLIASVEQISSTREFLSNLNAQYPYVSDGGSKVLSNEVVMIDGDVISVAWMESNAVLNALTAVLVTEHGSCDPAVLDFAGKLRAYACSKSDAHARYLENGFVS